MKIIIIILLTMTLLTILSLVLDMFIIGPDLHKVIHDWIRPFHAATSAEKIIYFLYPSLIAGLQIFSFLQRRKQNKTAK